MKPPTQKEIRKRLRKEITSEWWYWRPIAYKLVTLSLEEYSTATPWFVSKLNFAMDYRVELEKEALEEAQEGKKE